MAAGAPRPTRRAVLGGLAAGALLARVPALRAAPAAPGDAAAARHALSRLGFGPAPAALAWVTEVGPARWIEAQLHPEQIADPPALAEGLAARPTLALDPPALFREYGPPPAPPGGKPDAAVVKAQRERARRILLEAREARLMRAVTSPRQLEEVMVDLWLDHFNVFADKGLDLLWIGAFERQAIRPHALGRFADLLRATARHAAMLFYLDNWESLGPASPAARGKPGRGLNENYARELMELHTLGVDGGYGQADVVALARILTGWTIHRGTERDRPLAPGAPTGFFFDAKRHEPGDKTLLGRVIRAAGEAEGEAALDLLAHHPSTARHVATRLVRRLVSDTPDPALVQQVAQRFLETRGDIRETLRAIVRSPTFWDAATIGAKFKTPLRFVVSAVRATGVTVRNWQPLIGALARQGMPLYGCLTPDGWADTRAAWLNPDAMTQRLAFATALAAGQLRLDEPPPPADAPAPATRPKPVPVALETLGAATGADFAAPATRAAIDAAPPPLRAALLLGSPEFMRW